MKFNQLLADRYIHTQFASFKDASDAVTHLAIGAHQDDLEFMAYHGIASCYQKSNQWFAGITVTDGIGSSLGGQFAHLTPEELGAVRVQEQRAAAQLGEYAYQVQLGYASSEIKKAGSSYQSLIEELTQLLLLTKPKFVYLHQPADKHPTHIAVFKASIEALRGLADEYQPEHVYGCEGWRDLDWLSDEDKVALDVSAHPDLAKQLMLVFKSQIESGKRYDLATLGRRRANATYHNPHSLDEMQAVTWALDLQPLLVDKKMCIQSFIKLKIAKFENEVLANL